MHVVSRTYFLSGKKLIFNPPYSTGNGCHGKISQGGRLINNKIIMLLLKDRQNIFWIFLLHHQHFYRNCGVPMQLLSQEKSWSEYFKSCRPDKKKKTFTYFLFGILRLATLGLCNWWGGTEAGVTRRQWSRGDEEQKSRVRRDERSGGDEGV